MKRFHLVVCMIVVACGIIGISGNVEALSVLTNDAGEKVVDDGEGHYWIWDMAMYLNQTYNEQLVSIANSQYYGLSWHMATSQEYNQLVIHGYDVIAAAFSPSIIDGDFYNWAGHLDAELGGAPEYRYGANIVGFQDDVTGEWTYFPEGRPVIPDSPNNFYGAWMVADAPVPEPTTFLLLGAGLIGILGLKRRPYRQRRK